VCDFVPSPPVQAALDAPASLLFLAVVFAIDPVLGVLALVGVLVQVLIAYRTERGTMPALSAANRAANEARAYAAGALRSTPTLQAMGMLTGIRARWQAVQRRALLLQAQASEIHALNSAGSRVLQTLQGSAILGASCWLVLVGEFTSSGGLMIVASVLGVRVLTPLAQLVAHWRTVEQARDAHQRLQRLLANAPSPTPSMPLPAPRGVLTVEQVVASAPDSQAMILRGVSFSAQPGEVLAVIGPSASGKSTLARLITGIWPARAGKVRLDGADVYTWNRQELGPHVGYLSQQVDLFEGTLAENIARFGPVDLPQVQAAADLVGLRATIEAMPDAWDTRLGQDGAFLSGGMRQRVALARALYGRPRLVVLDEPNASLDEAGDAALASALLQLKVSGSTVVVISHRTSILPVADKLLVLRDGAVAAHGPRDEVIAGLQQQAAPGAPANAGVGVLRPGASPAVARGTAP
jgi:ATP-binding cassette, subfamily C, bacterial exporter for protease/lipase